MGAATAPQGQRSSASPLTLLRGLAGTLASAGRGSLAATLGTPGDLESLIRMLSGLDSNTYLPTTEQVSKRLPQLPPGFSQPTVESLTQFAPLSPQGALKLASHPAAASIAAGSMGVPGGLGIIGRRGAERMGLSSVIRPLEEEFNAAAKFKAQGGDPRMRSNAGAPLTYTGFDLKPRSERSTEFTRPKFLTPFDKPIPLKDAYHLDDWIEKAYPDLVNSVTISHPAHEPLGTGWYEPQSREIMVGAGLQHISPQNQEFLQKYPLALENRLAQIFGHEFLGHAVAREEDFLPGTSPELMEKVMGRNLTPSIEKRLLTANFMSELASGADPHRILPHYVSQAPQLERDFRSIIRNLQMGMSDSRSLAESAQHYANEAKKYIKSQEDTDLVNSIVHEGLKKYGSPELLRSAKNHPNEEAYLAYRANAGENEADLIGERMSYSLLDKKASPIPNENQFYNEHLHSVSR